MKEQMHISWDFQQPVTTQPYFNFLSALPVTNQSLSTSEYNYIDTATLWELVISFPYQRLLQTL